MIVVAPRALSSVFVVAVVAVAVVPVAVALASVLASAAVSLLLLRDWVVDGSVVFVHLSEHGRPSPVRTCLRCRTNAVCVCRI